MLQTCTNLNVRGNIQASEQERVKTCNVVLVLEMLVGGVLYITTSVSTVDLPAIAFWVQEFKSSRVMLRFNTLEGGSLTVCAMPTNTIGEVKQMLVDLHPMLHVKAHILTNELADDDQTVESLGPSPTVVYTKAEVEVATASAICEKGFVQVNIPEGVEIITAGAFKSCDQVVIVKACESLTEVRFCAFLGCKSLRELDLSRSSLTYIDTSAFANCRSLESVSLPETLAYISDCAFADCKSLRSITIPQRVTKIEGHAFKGCTSLESITMSADLQKDLHRAFDKDVHKFVHYI